MHTLWQDVRYGMRMLGKNPGFSVIAILTLALGIGANTAIYSLLQQVLLRRLPVKNPNELVVLRSKGPKTGSVWSDGDDAEPFSFPMYKALRENSSVFSGLIGRFPFSASIASHGQTEHGSGELVSGNYFEVLGIQPVVGRAFSLQDDRTPGAQPVVVLSYQYWTRRFGADPGVLNQTLLVNNTELTIVGVAQAGFTGVQVGQTPDVFVPLMMKAQMTPGHSGLDDWNDYWMAILGRLKPGESITRTQVGINAAYRPLLEEQVKKITGFNEQQRKEFVNQQMTLAPGSRGRTTVQRDTATPLKALFIMVALVLLIACTNVANLLLAQGAARQREFAIRSAMGATRWRMFRQLVAESLLCAFAGGAFGLLLGSWLIDGLMPTMGSDASIRGLSTKLDVGVLAFAAAATLISGLLFALLPAWHVTRTGVTQTLKDQGSTSSLGMSHVRLRKTLVAAQVAFTMLFLAGACLYTRTLWNLRKQNLGLRTENVITFSLEPDLNGYEIQRTIALMDQLRERIRAIPGVRGEGTSEIPTLTGEDMSANITVGSNPRASEEYPHVNFDAISPGYFSTLGIPVLSGRDLSNGDSATSPKVAVVSESMAKIFFPDRNPIGERFAFGGGKVTPDIQIVGVVKDAKQMHVRDASQPYIYLPYAQRKRLQGVSFYVRTQGDPLVISSALRDTVRGIDANLPVYDVKTFERVIDQDLFAERIVATLSASFGLLAAFLAALGIYGVLSYLVLQRTREIGIRVALGAEQNHVRFLVVREVGYMLFAGAAVGLPLSYGLALLSESLLFGVKAKDPLIYLLDVALIAVVAVSACYLPARRATRVDPIVALRYE